MLHHIISISLLSTILTFATPAIALDPALTKIQQSGVIWIGYRPTAAPLSYRSQDGQALGYATDLCRAVVSSIKGHLQLDVLHANFVPVTAEEGLQRIMDGRIQMECADTTNSKQRRARVAFGLAYYYASAKMMVKKNDPRKLMSEMEGQRIAVENGSTAQIIVQRRNKAGDHFTIVTVPNTVEGAQAVLSGRADAFVSNDLRLYEQAKASRGQLKVVGPRLSIEPLSVVVPKNSPELQTLVINSMNNLFRQGQARQLYEQWFQQPLPGLGYSLDIFPDQLLNDSFRRPVPFVTDWIVL
ncbi:transporter substrate-binding domain-containing protein [Ottowia sp.]|uniref:transporter substrate-binding domain-containing protein n=1 Tax=Ottowia sp. TaxID=1898956 RepID=UPI003A837E2E